MPEAVSALRDMRRRDADERIVVIAAADPLNLVGVIVPGIRIPALDGNRVAWVGGQYAGFRSGNDFHLAPDLAPGLATKVRTSLVGTAGIGAGSPPRRRWR